MIRRLVHNSLVRNLSVKPLVLVAVLAIACGLVVGRQGEQSVVAAENSKEDKMLSHSVYFTLNDSTPENRQKLVDDCKKYLVDHPGVVFFSAGVVCPEYDRPVNVLDYDVALHVVFADHAAHDKYQTAPTHLKFIEENRATWKQVRVYDADVDVAQPGK